MWRSFVCMLNTSADPLPLVCPPVILAAAWTDTVPFRAAVFREDESWQSQLLKILGTWLAAFSFVENEWSR